MARSTDTAAAPGVRLDRWLWAARQFKTRALATDEIQRGRIRVNDQPAKPSRDVRPGDRIAIRRQGYEQELLVMALSEVRGPAPVAQQLYQETASSLAAAQQAREVRRLGAEPALSQPDGRPTKRDRRQLANWQRWSASIDKTST